MASECEIVLQIMVEKRMNIILLSGGSGKRLWPLSNDALSKQFLKLLENENGEKESMVQRVYRQINKVIGDSNIVIATGRSQVDSIESQLPDSISVVTEPERRNTYPAILLACAYLKFKKNVKDDEPVMVLPVDPYTEDSFFEALKKMEEQINKNSSDLVLMGIKPTEPSEKYGYIICEDKEDEIKAVKKFVEKPSRQKAIELIEENAYWNAGIFGFKLSIIMDLLGREIDCHSFEDVYNGFSKLSKNSFDYEVVEKTESISMIPFNGQWKDLGTWNSLSEEMPCQVLGNVICDDCSNTAIINVNDKPVVVLGIDNSIVINSVEGVLVSNKNKIEGIKKYVENLGDRPLYENRRWGKYKVVDQCDFDDGVKTLTKHLLIKEGKSITYQRHQHRREVWVIVDGEGELLLDGETRLIRRGDIVNIEKGQKHKISALTTLHIIEIQIGDILTEDDVERFE